MKEPARILIVKPSSLGDVATCLPLLCDLKIQFPKARIDWVISPAFDALIKSHRSLDQCIYFDRAALAGWCWRPAAIKLLRQLITQLRAAKYDVAIDAQGLMRSALLTWASGAPMRIGPGDAREGARFLYTHCVNSRRDTELAVDRMRLLQTPLAQLRQKVEFNVPIDAAAAATAAQWLGGGSRSKFLALLPAARWGAKVWSAEGYIEVGRRAVENGLGVVILGTAAEAPMCDALAQAVGENALNLAGKTNLAEMIAVLNRMSLVVGNDTGPLHVAAALGRPVIGLYGPTDERSVGPWGQLDHVLRFGPVADYRQGAGRIIAANLRVLPAEMVWGKMRELLGEN